MEWEQFKPVYFKNARKIRKLTLAEVGKAIHFSVSGLSQLEAGTGSMDDSVFFFFFFFFDGRLAFMNVPFSNKDRIGEMKIVFYSLFHMKYLEMITADEMAALQKITSDESWEYSINRYWKFIFVLYQAVLNYQKGNDPLFHSGPACESNTNQCISAQIAELIAAAPRLFNDEDPMSLS